MTRSALLAPVISTAPPAFSNNTTGPVSWKRSKSRHCNLTARDQIPAFCAHSDSAAADGLVSPGECRYSFGSSSIPWWRQAWRVANTAGCFAASLPATDSKPESERGLLEASAFEPGPLGLLTVNPSSRKVQITDFYSLFPP